MTHVESRQRRKSIADMLKKGVPVTSCCQAFGCSVAQVQYSAKEHGIPLKIRVRGLAETTWDVLEMLIKTEETLAAIGDKFGISRQRVEQILRAAERAGVKFEGRR